MKKIFSKEFIIGLCVIAAIVILCVGIDYLKGVNIFKPANFYTARYDNVSGLEVAAPVTIDGFKVGQVRDIIFDYEHPGKIEVLLALNKSLRIPEDSKAVIGSTLLSGGFVDIQLGKSSKLIELGGEIPTGTSPDLMSSLSNDVLPAVNAVIPKVDSLLTSLNRLASDPALVNSFKNIEGITLRVYDAAGSLNSLMGKDMPLMIGKVDGIVTNLDTVAGNLSQLSEELKKLPLASTMNNVEEITANLNTFSQKLNSSESSLGLLMNDPELYHRINTVVADVDSLIVDIQKNPKRYISIKLL